MTLAALAILLTIGNTVLFTRYPLEFVPARRQPCRFVVSLLYAGMENRSPVSLVASQSSSATTCCRNVDVVSRGRFNIAASITQLQCRRTLYEIRKYPCQTHSICRSSTGYRPLVRNLSIGLDPTYTLIVHQPTPRKLLVTSPPVI